MKRHPLFLATVLVVASLGIATVAVAQSTAAPDKPPRIQLDANGDGVIDRSEAAASPRLAAKFAELDKDGDGRLDASERPQRKGKRGRHHGGIAMLDSDGDGRISRAELEQAQGARKHGRGGGQHGLVENFAAIDANKDGYIVRGELRAWHERMRPQREAERAQRSGEKFAEADLNRDGKLSRVEVDEKMPRLAKQFAWMDENRDGFLSREEMQPQGRR